MDVPPRVARLRAHGLVRPALGDRAARRRWIAPNPLACASRPWAGDAGVIEACLVAALWYTMPRVPRGGPGEAGNREGHPTLGPASAKGSSPPGASRSREHTEHVAEWRQRID